MIERRVHRSGRRRHTKNDDSNAGDGGERSYVDDEKEKTLENYLTKR